MRKYIDQNVQNIKHNKDEKIINDVYGYPETNSTSRNVTKYSIWRGYNIRVQCMWLKYTVYVTKIYSVCD